MERVGPGGRERGGVAGEEEPVGLGVWCLKEPLPYTRINHRVPLKQNFIHFKRGFDLQETFQAHSCWAKQALSTDVRSI